MRLCAAFFLLFALPYLPMFSMASFAQDVGADTRKASFLPPPTPLGEAVSKGLASTSLGPASKEESPPNLSAPPPFSPAATGAVTSNPLPSVSPETTGTLAPSEGGLGTALWEGTDRAGIDAILAATPLPTPSATLNDLARRLFLSEAVPPILATNAPQPTRSFLSLRLESLIKLGAVREAWQLLSALDQSRIDTPTLRLLAEAVVTSGEAAAACKTIPSLMKTRGKEGDEDAAWQKILLLCHLYAGDEKAVQLGLDLMREQKVKDDLFLSIMNRNVLGKSQLLPHQLTPLRPATLAALLATKIPLPTSLYRRPDASLVPGLLLSTAADDAARLAMAERAAAQGIITRGQLSQAYESAIIKDAAPNANTAQTVGEKGAAARALLYKTILNEKDTAQKVSLIKRYHETDGGAIGERAALLADLLESLPPTEMPETMAPVALRTEILASRPAKALEWLKILRDGTGKESSEKEGRLSTNADYWPLRALAGLVPDGLYAEEMAAWLQTDGLPAQEKDERRLDAARERAGAQILLLSALGYAVPEQAWKQALSFLPPVKRFSPSPILLERLRQAAAAQKVGETILLSLFMIGETNESVDIGVKTEIVRALRLVGMKAEAGMLAREIAAAL